MRIETPTSRAKLRAMPPAMSHCRRVIDVRPLIFRKGTKWFGSWRRLLPAWRRFELAI
jgi:hypothetical protein